jgi:Rho GTPase-activating protein 26
MGLLPLEFTDCLTDSPYFREKLHGHEKELEKTSQQIKGLIKELNNVISAAKSK